MPTIPGSLLSQFNTNQSPLQDYIPLWNSVDYAGSLGTIDRIDVDASGIGYGYSNTSPNDKYQGLFDTPAVPIFIEGDGGSTEITKIKIADNGTTNGGLTSFNDNADDMITDTVGGYADISRNTPFNNWVPVKFLEDAQTFTEAQLSNINLPN